MVSNNGFLKLLFTGIFIWLTFATLAQSTRNCEYIRPHQADHWVFGKHGGIDFSTTPPQAVVTAGGYEVSFGVSSYSDEQGNFKFFSNGIEVYNGSYYQSANGSGLEGKPWSSMSSIFVPNPANSKQLFVFTIDFYLKGIYDNGVTYSVVDFSTNGGGEILHKNELLFKENAQKVCAVKHENKRDYWVIFHGYGPNNGDSYYSYLVDTGGVNMTPVISKVGHYQAGFDADFGNNGGYMKFSPDGTKIAAVVPYDGLVEVLDFNNVTGTVSNPQQSIPGDLIMPYGVEFSPDNSKLYVTTQPLPEVGESLPAVLYQFDFNKTLPLAPPYTIIEQFDYSLSGSQDSTFGALQLAPDGKIYVSKFLRQALNGKSTLSVIYNPNREGFACNYNTLNGSSTLFNLEGGMSMLGLPTFITDYLNIPHFSFFNKCENDTTEFKIRNTANLNASWNFDLVDPSGTLVYPDPLNPGFVFSEPKTYQIELTEEWGGQEYSFINSITINPLPNVEIGKGSDTISILPNSSIRLDAGEYDYYQWNPGGSRDRYLDVSQEGWYEVLVTDTNCCSNTDRVYIMFADLTYPNAFRPNSPLTRNQTFGVIGDVASLAQFKLLIFDRWGKIVFETDDPKTNWDGRFEGGENAPQGLYTWHSVFTTFESGLEPSRNIQNRGTVMLVR